MRRMYLVFIFWLWETFCFMAPSCSIYVSTSSSRCSISYKRKKSRTI